MSAARSRTARSRNRSTAEHGAPKRAERRTPARQRRPDLRVVQHAPEQAPLRPTAAPAPEERPTMEQAAALAGETLGPLGRARAIESERDLAESLRSLVSIGLGMLADGYRLVRAVVAAPFRIARALRIEPPVEA